MSDAWKPSVRQTVQRRAALKKTGLVVYNVHIWQAVIRRGREFDRCPHGHTKRSAALLCAQREARRRNKADGT
jgi:hypothetical protein